MQSPRSFAFCGAAALYLAAVLSAPASAGEGLAGLGVRNSAQAGEGSLSMGTGWPVGSGYVVTNFHVIANHVNFALMRTDRTLLKAHVVYADRANDLALLRAEKPGKLPPALPLADQGDAVGQSVFTIGYPQPAIMGAAPKLSTGVINAVTGIRDDPRMLQTSVTIHPGNSGGPLINMNGDVVGVVSQYLDAQKMYKYTGESTQNVNYAVKIDYLRPMLALIRGFKGIEARGPKGRTSLENLSRRYMDSTLIVFAGYRMDEGRGEAGSGPARRRQSRRVVVAAYAEPGNYDLDNYPKANQVETLSKAASAMVVEFLKRYRGTPYRVLGAVWGHSAEALIGSADDNMARRRLCRKERAQFLLIVDSPQGFDGSNRIVHIGLYNCAKHTQYAHSYNVFRRGPDKFGYEVEMRRKLNKFLADMRLEIGDAR